MSSYSAPLLFARLLRLSQIDNTLGPMIQVTNVSMVVYILDFLFVDPSDVCSTR